MKGFDSRERDAWLAALRDRFTGIARRRVQPDDVEDVVQSAMGVVVEKGVTGAGPQVEGLPPVAWCLQVLRNTIGNHYKRQQTRKKWVAEGVETGHLSAPLESRNAAGRVEVIEAALDDMAQTDPQCGSYLQRTVDGVPARDIAAAEGLDADAFYKRLYRCRQKLREILRHRGVLPS
jgi:DNA-directed RNA polymerase specialized sigma24 family protein